MDKMKTRKNNFFREFKAFIFIKLRYILYRSGLTKSRKKAGVAPSSLKISVQEASVLCVCKGSADTLFEAG
jgi:hypothetical protein